MHPHKKKTLTLREKEYNGACSACRKTDTSAYRHARKGEQKNHFWAAWRAFLNLRSPGTISKILVCLRLRVCERDDKRDHRFFTRWADFKNQWYIVQEEQLLLIFSKNSYVFIRSIALVSITEVRRGRRCSVKYVYALSNWKLWSRNIKEHGLR